VANGKSNSSFLFTSESVSQGHPDKVCDQISDAVLDSLLKHDPHARCALETMVTTGLVVMAGEITVHNEAAAQALANAEQTARETIREIGYTDPEIGFDYRSCGVLRAIHSQSADISQGVSEGQGLHKEQAPAIRGSCSGSPATRPRSSCPCRFTWPIASSRS